MKTKVLTKMNYSGMICKTSIFFVLFALPLLCSAQTPPVSQPTLPSESDEVVRISTELVKVDAVVVDQNGKQISNLTVDDFEVFQDGKLQKITNFSYISAEIGRRSVSGKTEIGKHDTTFEPPVNIRADRTRRTITFVVDNGGCAASQSGVAASREALLRFVNEQMRSGDLVAVYQTKPGSSLTGQYTSDKAQLRLIISKIGWSSSSICDSRGGDLFEREKADYTLKASGQGRRTFESAEDRKARETFEDSIRDNRTLSIIETLKTVSRRLKGVSGRKVIFFLSDGFPVINRDDRETRTLNSLRSLIAEANRSSIVFNSIDARGQFNAALLRAEDEVLPEQPNVAKPTSTEKAIINRLTEARNLQDGLAILAIETGGGFSKGSNRLDSSIRDLLNLEKGYYLFAYQPEEGSFAGRKYHKIEIKLKRADWQIFSRSGFFAGIEEGTNANSRTHKPSEIAEILNSAFPRTELSVGLNAFYSNTGSDGRLKEGDFVYSMMRLNGRDIRFVDDGNGYKKAVLDVTFVLLDEKNKPAKTVSRIHTLRLSAQEVAKMQEKGLTYPVFLPANRSGLYDVRVIVRDVIGEKTGSASRRVEVPDLKQGELFFPVITLNAVDENSAVVPPRTTASDSLTEIGSIKPRFRRGDVVAYAFTLYNAEVDRSSRQPKIRIQVSLYQKETLLFETAPQSPPLEAKSNRIRIDTGGYFKLDHSLKNDEFTLRIRIEDLLSGKTIEQTADFVIE